MLCALSLGSKSPRPRRDLLGTRVLPSYPGEVSRASKHLWCINNILFCQQMAPMRGERGGSPARAARASLPLPRRLIRQIARHVASSGRSLRRLEVSGCVIDNFDDIEAASEESDMETSQPA